MKTARHFPRFVVVDTLNGWITSNKSFVDSFIVGQFQTRSITELVDKATLILYWIYRFLHLSISSFLQTENWKLKKKKWKRGSTSKKRAHVMYRYNTCSIHVLLELVHVHTYICLYTAENTRYQMRPHQVQKSETRKSWTHFFHAFVLIVKYDKEL